MDLRQVADRFQQDQMDAYDFSGTAWILNAFKGKIKFSPESFGVNDLSSKKRMLFTQATGRPQSSVIRNQVLNEIYLVENPQGDVLSGQQYQTVYNIHRAIGGAQLSRKQPLGPSDDPGWAINNQVQNTFADVEFQRVPMDQETTVNQYGLYIVYLPSNCPARDHDTVEVGGQTYYLFEVYADQGLKVARATNKPDLRRNIVYTVVTNTAYDPSILSPGKTQTNYNVTAQIEPIDIEDTSAGNLLKDAIKVLIDTAWIGVVPKVNDKLTFGGKIYVVAKITQNMILDQWVLIASV